MNEMKHHYFICGNGGNASIQENYDGSATLRMFNGFKAIERKCKSLASAKRMLSRWTDGFFRERKFVGVE